LDIRLGHGGEVALNYCMHGSGGFEGNGHTLRLLSRLENFSENEGSNLARRTMLAVLKYPIPFSKAANPLVVPKLDARASSIRTLDRKSSKPPKCYFDSEKDVVEWVLEPLINRDRDEFQAVSIGGKGKHYTAKHKSFDCSIMDLSDDIAYGVHDLEDAIALQLVTEASFRDIVKEDVCSPFLQHLKATYPGDIGNDVYDYCVRGLFSTSKQRKRFIGRLVHLFVMNVGIETVEELEEPLIRYRAVLPGPHRKFLDALQSLIEAKVIFTPNVQHLEFKGQKMVISVFEALQSDTKNLLPEDALALFESSGGDARVICDYVAGMTDAFLLKTYDRLFSPRMGSVFDKL
jgi:dGTPase